MISMDLNNPLNDETIAEFYPQEPGLRQLLLTHSVCVAKKALEIADHYASENPDKIIDRDFIAKASLLHDIGIQNCDAPDIYCFGQLPYICHGVEGSRMLAEKGLIRYAFVCERHTGSGLTAEEIEEEALPIPARDMLPVSIEEKIICLADKFFSKNPASLTREKSIDEVRKSISKFGDAPMQRLNDLISLLL